MSRPYSNILEKYGSVKVAMGEEIYQQGRTDALEEFRKKINNYLNESSDFADFVVTDNSIDRVLDEMKGE